MEVKQKKNNEKTTKYERSEFMNANEKKIISCEMDTQKAPREHYTQSCEDNAKP